MVRQPVHLNTETVLATPFLSLLYCTGLPAHIIYFEPEIILELLTKLMTTITALLQSRHANLSMSTEANPRLWKSDWTFFSSSWQRQKQTSDTHDCDVRRYFPNIATTSLGDSCAHQVVQNHPALPAVPLRTRGIRANFQHELAAVSTTTLPTLNNSVTLFQRPSQNDPCVNSGLNLNKHCM